MTTLYRTVLIESAEQAEALPIGTIAYATDDPGMVAIRTPSSGSLAWNVTEGHDPAHGPRFVVGWTALVPIEAEEETTGTGLHELDQGAPILNLGYYRASTRCLCGYEVIWGEHDGDAGLDEAWRVHLMRSKVSTARAMRNSA